MSCVNTELSKWTMWVWCLYNLWWRHYRDCQSLT